MLEKHQVVRCTVKRVSDLLGFSLVITNDVTGHHILTAKKEFLTRAPRYVFSTDAQKMTKNGPHYVAKLRHDTNQLYALMLGRA